MGLRRTWAWDKIDWDDEIRRDRVAFHGSCVMDMNSSELVEVLNLRGVRAHRGLSLEELRELLFSSLRGEVPQVDHPLDFLRKRILWFVDTFRTQIKDQITEDCDCACWEKPDAEVLICYTASQKIIERKIESHGYQDR